MRKVAFTICILTILLLLGCDRAQDKSIDSDKTINSTIEQGTFEDQAGTSIGKCTIEKKFLNPGWNITYTYYTSVEVKLGKCTTYDGPGMGIYCNYPNCDSEGLVQQVNSTKCKPPLKYFCRNKDGVLLP